MRRANCTIRGAFAVEEIIPNEPADATFAPGLLKFGWLNRLKNSERNSRLVGSRNGNIFERARSVFQNLGPTMKFLGALPKPVPSPMTGGGAKTLVLKNLLTVRDCNGTF